MKYKMEIFIIIILFSSITILDIYTKKNTEHVFSLLETKLIELKSSIEKDSFDIEKMKEINDIWNDKLKILSLYLEHDELEKVGNVNVRLFENVKNNEKEIALENIEEIKFLLEHIKNKSRLTIEGVF